MIVRPARGVRGRGRAASSARASIDYAATLRPDRRLVLDHYHFEDFARKVVGVGSVGTEAFMILLMGDREEDPLFLQIKEANRRCSPPTPATASTSTRASAWSQGQRLMQSASDVFLGWVTGPGERLASSTCASCAT